MSKIPRGKIVLKNTEKLKVVFIVIGIGQLKTSGTIHGWMCTDQGAKL